MVAGRRRMQGLKGAGAALALALSLAPNGVSAEDRTERTAHLSGQGAATAPIGWRQFCLDFPIDCRARPARVETAKLTRAVWTDLLSVNRRVNHSIAPITDMQQYGVEERWTYPVSGKGDCEDYAILKKQMLIRAGLPASAVLLTVVRDLRGDGHAVLTVRTDRGDYILDNETDEIRLWHETGYRFVKRQSEEDPSRWVTIGPGSAPASVAAR